MDFLPEKIDEYAIEHSQPEPEILKELSRETWQKVLAPRMLSGHLQGRILSMLSKLIRPKYILEIGTYTGYSALCLAEGMQASGELHTIDINEELEPIQTKYFENRNVAKYSRCKYSEIQIQKIFKITRFESCHMYFRILLYLIIEYM